MSTPETAENSKAIAQVIKDIISKCLETDKLKGRERTSLQVLEDIRTSAQQELNRAQNVKAMIKEFGESTGIFER